MSLVPAMDLRPANQVVAAPPANVEAEQALLGVLLYDNEAFHRFEGLQASHFYEPFHERLWQAIVDKIGKGLMVEPILLAEQFARDPAFEQLGGVRYLADLVDRAPPAFGAPSYAGEIIDTALRRELIRIGTEAAASADQDRSLTGREHVEEVEQRLFSLAETQASRGFRSFSTHLSGAVDMVARAVDSDGGISGVSTGLIDLDRKLGGLRPTDLIILAARPSMGKTALATNISFNVAKRYAFEMASDGTRKTTAGGVVGFFSLEMSGEQLSLRLLAEACGIPGDKLHRGDIRPDEFARVRDAAQLISEIPLHIDDTAGLTIAKLAARARRLKRTVGLDLIVVDYLQLVTCPGRRGEGRVQEVSEITMGLKALAKDLRVPVLALAQLSRQVENREDKKPQLSDLRESGSIEQDADVVMFLYRESYYLGRTEPKAATPAHLNWQDAVAAARGVAEVIIGKARHGPIGTVKLSFNEDLTKFGNLAREGRIDFGAVRLPYAEDS